MDDDERARLLVEGMAEKLHLSPDAAERLRAGFAEALPQARAGQLSPDALRRILAEVDNRDRPRHMVDRRGCITWRPADE